MKEGRRKSYLTYRGTRIRITLDFFQKSHKKNGMKYLVLKGKKST